MLGCIWTGKAPGRGGWLVQDDWGWSTWESKVEAPCCSPFAHTALALPTGCLTRLPAALGLAIMCPRNAAHCMVSKNPVAKRTVAGFSVPIRLSAACSFVLCLVA